METEKRLIDPNDVYALFGENGMARLHVGDIDQIKRVDAVEVVRCQFCEYYNSIMGLCCVDRKLGQTIPPVRVKHSDFCSYGEMRTDG